MDKKIKFIFDGDCPFCNYFGELLELRTKLNNLEILDGRKNLPLLTKLLKQGYDINNGAILIMDKQILSGANAISFICSKIDNPSMGLLKVISLIFKSKKRSSLIFPILVISRRIILFLKGIPIRPVRNDMNYL
tara:strand:+ start:13034 stop:13435 length:402 start_codon:yes stop_codon:yes gene_type:complete